MKGQEIWDSALFLDHEQASFFSQIIHVLAEVYCYAKHRWKRGRIGVDSSLFKEK